MQLSQISPLTKTGVWAATGAGADSSAEARIIRDSNRLLLLLDPIVLAAALALRTL
jgi:hypothetical protein